MPTLVEFNEEANYCLIGMDDGKANALSFDMLAQVNAALDQTQQAGKIVIICGRPGKFSAGFDLSVMSQGGDAMLDLLQQGAALSRRLLNFETPVILGISGHALAMGALLVLSADYRIGIHGNYKIGLNEVAIGMTLPYFGIELAKARLSKRHINNAVGLARLYNATGAAEAGYLDEAVNEDEMLPRAIALAEQLAQLDMNAHRQTKARVREHLNAALDSALQREFAR
jgi:enoyl-CoA hydratase